MRLRLHAPNSRGLARSCNVRILSSSTSAKESCQSFSGVFKPYNGRRSFQSMSIPLSCSLGGHT
eukprot:4353708-Lingulodinium_polyedra.AAC.1